MKRIIAFLVMFSLIFTGCSGITNSDKNSEDGGNHAGIKAGKTVESNYNDMDVEIVDTPPEPMRFPGRSLGNVAFTVDKGRTASLQCPADGKEKSISVKDDSGVEWTLSIPGNGLIKEEEISITPLNNIEVDTLPGSKLHGLMLKPDGLDFLKCLTISIKKSGESIKGMVLTAKHDGSELVLCPVDAYDGGVKAPLEHFSTLFFLPNSDPAIAELKEKAKAQYDEAVEAAEELLKKSITVPAPPSISFECMNDQKIARAKEYAELVPKEEEEVLGRLLSADRSISLLSGEDSDFSLAIRILNRMKAKVSKIIRQYEPDPEKLLAVFHAAVRVWRQYDFLTGDGPQISTFLGWAENARKYYMDRLIKDHEYKAFGAALELDRMCDVLGGSGNLQQIISALTFKLTVETVLDVPGYNITVKGEGTLKAVSESDTIYSMYDKTLFVQGTGTLGYIYNGQDKDLTIKPEEFPVKIQVRNWNPCESNTIDILIESLGSDDEEHAYDLADGKVSYNDPIVNDFAEGFFEEEITEVPFGLPEGGVIAVQMINFNADLRNGQATAAVETIDRKQPGTEARILVHLQLEHTPE